MQANIVPIWHSTNLKQSILSKSWSFSASAHLLAYKVSQMSFRLLEKSPLKDLLLENTDRLFQQIKSESKYLAKIFLPQMKSNYYYL